MVADPATPETEAIEEAAVPTEAVEETAVEVPVIDGEEPAPIDVIGDVVDPVIDPAVQNSDYVVGTLTWEALEK